MNRPNLPLTAEERKSLRRNGVTLTMIHTYETEDLRLMLRCSKERAETLRALAVFQHIPSIGLKGAEQVVYGLGVLSLQELAEKSGADWLDELEQNLGVWTDPCVEDQLRCMVHHARHPNSSRKWFDFTVKRKEYRAEYGYPVERPERAWYE